ncbi:MAG: endonuclease domain-containing protein [Thermosynechococcaceae cyanobacterium MS004]|nr:endonuclease domain-containing protein [Thermosynechococcaceae cyanobacterium MS004]
METKAYFIPYEPHLKELARQLRHNMTQGEVILWQHLKRRQMCGLDFDRQRPIDAYIVDFYCKRLRLAVEVDGNSHDGEVAQQNDFVRQTRLESLGVRFLRFSETQVCHQTQSVLNTIKTWILNHPP